MAGRLRISDDQLVQISSMIAITLLVVAGLVVLALVPSVKDNVIPVVSVGITAIASYSRRQNAPPAPPTPAP